MERRPSSRIVDGPFKYSRERKQSHNLAHIPKEIEALAPPSTRRLTGGTEYGYVTPLRGADGCGVGRGLGATPWVQNAKRYKP